MDDVVDKLSMLEKVTLKISDKFDKYIDDNSSTISKMEERIQHIKDLIYTISNSSIPEKGGFLGRLNSLKSKLEEKEIEKKIKTLESEELDVKK